MSHTDQTSSPDQDGRTLTLRQLAAELLPNWPCEDKGSIPTVDALYARLRRFALRDGDEGPRLEAWKFGNIWTVTRAAWERFVVACTEHARRRATDYEPPAAGNSEALREEARALGIL